MKIRFDEETCNNEVYNVYGNNQNYKVALKEFEAAIDTNNKMTITDAAIYMETAVADIVYKKAFHDGMNFILNALAGKEVIEL